MFQKIALFDSEVTSYLFRSQNPHFEAKNGICLSVSDRKLACRAKYFFVGNNIFALGKYLKLVSIDYNKTFFSRFESSFSFFLHRCSHFWAVGKRSTPT